MKKIAIALAALAVAATVASAAVYSQNAVGFINVDIQKGELVVLTIPFNDMNSDSGTVVFRETQMAKEAANNSTVYFWEKDHWASFQKGRSGWTTPKELLPGEMFFYKPAADQVVTINGEVPDEASLDVKVVGSGNLSAIGCPYPISMTFKESTLAADAKNNSTVYFWEKDHWASFQKGRSGWTTPKVLSAGEGFFFKTNKTDPDTTWTVTKEYDYP